MTFYAEDSYALRMLAHSAKRLADHFAPEAVEPVRPPGEMTPERVCICIDVMPDGRLAIEQWAHGRRDATYMLRTVEQALTKDLPLALRESVDAVLSQRKA